MSLSKLITAAALACIPAFAGASTHLNKQVTIIHSPDYRDCVFFQLAGIGEADPVLPGSPWFAVPRTHGGFKEITAMLLSARLSGTPINVVTTGTQICGHAGVIIVEL